MELYRISKDQAYNILNRLKIIEKSDYKEHTKPPASSLSVKLHANA